LARRRVTSAAVLAICTALLLAAAAPASAVTRKQATKHALAALGSKSRSGPVVVSGLKNPLRAGTRITQAGSGKHVITVGKGGAFFYYENSAPSRPYPHRGRVALVGAKSGKVRLSGTITRAPRVNGKSRTLSVVYRAGDPFAPTPVFTNSPPKADRQDVRVKQDKPKRITLTGSDPDDEMLTFGIWRRPSHGTLSGQAPDVVYTPDPGYLGSDSFSFKTYDDTGRSDTAKVSITVVPLGAPPVVTASAGCTGYIEQTAAVAVDDQITVADADDPVLDSAQVRIAAGQQGGDDLRFTDQNGIAGSYDDISGVLTLNGTATVAQYEAALRTVRYRNLASGHPPPTKTIEFTANDAGNDSAPTTKQICITETGANDRPTGGTSEGALNYTENDGPVPIDADFFATDPDSADLIGATVKFSASQPSEEEELFESVGGDATSTFVATEDVLAFADQNGITGSWDGENGVLTLTGTSSIENYETAIRSVTYENTSENPSPAPRTIRFQLTDSTGSNSLPASRGILVTPVNDAPVVTPSEGTTGYTEGDPATAVDPSLTAGDVDDTELEGGQVRIASGFETGDDLAYADQSGIAGAYDSESGVLTLTGTASVADYETALRSIEYSGTSDNPEPSKIVEFTVNDGDLDSIAATKEIAVTGVNDKPVLDSSDDALSYTEGAGAVAIDPDLTASDVDSATFAGATVQITDGFSSGSDSLALPEQPAIGASYDSESGTLTLSGTATVAEYETALRAVTYENTSDNPTTARTISFQVDDGALAENLSDAVTRDIAITPVNDTPAVATSDGTTAYTFGDSGQTVDDGLTVTDVDDENIESARVRISDGFEAGDDLVYVDQLGIAGVYNTGTGELTLTGSAPVADYETALRSIQYSSTAETPAASKTVEFVVNDGDDDSNAALRSISLSLPSTDVAPVVTASAGSASYTLDDAGGSVVDPGLTVTDADDVNIESAHVQIDGFEPGDDLVWSDQLGISGGFDSEVGALDLVGTASLADYETALRSIKFRHFGDNQSAFRTVAFKVNDGELDSEFALKTVDLVTPAP
jgi:Bacterial Ig domain